MSKFHTIGLTLAFLTGCGGEDGPPSAATTPPDSTGVIDAKTPPPPAPPPSSTPSQTAASANPFASFDFEGGNVYPATARVSIGDVSVPIGATSVDVPIRLDRPTPNTVIARVLTRNGSGEKYGYAGQHFTKTDTYVIFRPGDPLERTVRIPVRNMDAGRHFELIFPSGVSGGVNADGVGTITAVVDGVPTVPKTSGFRAPRTFTPTGTLTYRLDPATVRWSDAGGTDAWVTKLPHGRTQPANGETGLYLDPVLHNAAMPAISIENNDVVLRSQQLVSPIFHDAKYWYHGAAMLTGQKMPATHLQYGQYEWDAMMPNRRGGWPALWLLPTTGWPPEIDVYEGFGYSSGWKFSSDYSANIHGGSKGVRRFTAPTQLNASAAFGINGFDTSYHRFAVDIAPDYITWFIDGIEVYQTVNPFRGITWFPLMNVAVKHNGDYVGGTAEMRVRSFTVWRGPD